MTDPISDFLSRVHNAILGRKATVEVPASTLKKHLAELLRDEGYLTAVAETGDAKRPLIQMTLRWDPQNKPAISHMKRISRPGQRRYVPADAIPKVRGGLGVAIVSTSKGLMTDRAARKANLGGEILCEVW